MLETVLYEYGFDWSKTIGFFPMIVLGVCFFFGNSIIEASSPDIHSLNAKSINSKTIKRILRSIGVFCWISFVVFFSSHIREHCEYNNILKNGDFLTIVGYVENFDPLFWHEKDAERFEINGVCFEYSDSGVNGYQVTAERGGVVTQNGQHLKIKYITNEDGENIILYIAEIE